MRPVRLAELSACLAVGKFKQNAIKLLHGAIFHLAISNLELDHPNVLLVVCLLTGVSSQVIMLSMMHSIRISAHLRLEVSLLSIALHLLAGMRSSHVCTVV